MAHHQRLRLTLPACRCEASAPRALSTGPQLLQLEDPSGSLRSKKRRAADCAFPLSLGLANELQGNLITDLGHHSRAKVQSRGLSAKEKPRVAEPTASSWEEFKITTCSREAMRTWQRTSSEKKRRGHMGVGQKNMCPTWNPGKLKQQPTPAVPW